MANYALARGVKRRNLAGHISLAGPFQYITFITKPFQYITFITGIFSPSLYHLYYQIFLAGPFQYITFITGNCQLLTIEELSSTFPFIKCAQTFCIQSNYET